MIGIFREPVFSFSRYFSGIYHFSDYNSLVLVSGIQSGMGKNLIKIPRLHMILTHFHLKSCPNSSLSLQERSRLVTVCYSTTSIRAQVNHPSINAAESNPQDTHCSSKYLYPPLNHHGTPRCRPVGSLSAPPPQKWYIPVKVVCIPLLIAAGLSF